MQLPKPRHSWIPYIVLTGTLLLTFFVASGAQRAAVEKDRLQFENASHHTSEHIRHRLETYIALLRAGRSLFAANDSVSREQFHKYVERQEIQQHYPGVLGVGFSLRIKPEEQAAILADLQKQGLKNFQIKPEYNRSEYHASIYLEPLDRRNQVAIGFDMFTEPVRRAAMERARDTGLPAASGRVTLVQEIDRNKQAGFVIYVPVYQDGVTPSTVTERRAKLRGFVYSAFRVDDLMAGIFADEEMLLVDFQIYSGKTVNSANLLYNSANNSNLKDVASRSRLTQTKTLTIAGQPWTVVFTCRAEIDAVSERRLIPYIWMVGLIISFVLFVLLRSQVRALAHLHKSQAALRQSESRLRRLVDANIIGIIISDNSGRVLEANNAFLNIVGYSREDVLSGKVNRLQMTPPEYQYLDEQVLEKMRLTGSHPAFEKEYIRKDGTRVPVLVGTALLEEYSKMEVGFVLDLTEQKQAEVALQQTNERLAFLYSMSSNLLLHEEPKTFIKNLFSQLSHHLNLEFYFNYLIDADEQTLDLHAFGGVIEEITEQINRSKLGEVIIANALQQQKPDVVENIQLSNDSALELVRSLGITAYACYPLLAREQLIGILCFATCKRHQFTSEELALMQVACDQVATALERSRLLAELQNQTEELKQANQMKDEFLATLSHELRTPLTSMLGWTNLLRTRKFNEETTAKALETLDRNTQSLAQLIEDILDVSRIITGKICLQVQPMRLVPTIEAAIDTVRPAAEAKQIQLKSTFDLSNISKIYVRGDTTRLQQVFWNLLSNAIKFTPNGGRVEVGLEIVGNSSFGIDDNEESTQNKYVQIQIKDNGQGINPDFLPFVFERFRQADGKITRVHGGLGLGLAIVRHLVELHGGTVQAESAGEGQGATFTVNLPYLPILQATNNAEHTQLVIQEKGQLGELRSLHGIQVLVVDDEADAREFIVTVLQQAGAEVSTAANATQALEALQHQKPHILISDIGMPGEDGYTLIRKVRELNLYQGRQIPAVALTAYVRTEDCEQAIQAGFQRHIPKPVHPVDLTAIVAELVLL